MKRQRGQAAVEFAIMLPIVLSLIFAGIYGGAMFIQFLNFNNEARTIARQIAVAPASDRQTLITRYTVEEPKEFGIYLVTCNPEITKDAEGNDEDVVVTYEFNRSEGSSPFFGFPPPHFATSYRMKLE